MPCQPRNAELGRTPEMHVALPGRCAENNLHFLMLGLCTCSVMGSASCWGFLPSLSKRHGQSEAAKGPRLLNVLCSSFQSAGFKLSVVRLPVTKESQGAQQPGFLKIFFFPLPTELTNPWPKPLSCPFLSLCATVFFFSTEAQRSHISRLGFILCHPELEKNP